MTNFNFASTDARALASSPTPGTFNLQGIGIIIRGDPQSGPTPTPASSGTPAPTATATATATASPTATPTPSTTPTPSCAGGGSNITIYDQLDNAGTNATNSQDFEAANAAFTNQG